MKKRVLKASSAALGGLALLVGLSTPVAAAPQPSPTVSLGSDLVTGQAEEFGHTGQIAICQAA